MVKDFIKQKKEEIEEFLRNSYEHNNKKIDYILYNEETQDTDILASNPDGEEAIEFRPYTKDNINGYYNVPEWDYNFDYYIYNLLEEDWKIGYMTLETHYGIWSSINELYPEAIDFKDGMQKYLKYCKENNITKEYLDNQLKIAIPNVNTPDITKFYNDKELKFKEDYNFKVKQEILKIKLVGIDNWDRPVYKDYKGTFYKDVNLGTGNLALYTSSGNKFEGEPDYPLSNNTKINIVKSFKKNNELER